MKRSLHIEIARSHIVDVRWGHQGRLEIRFTRSLVEVTMRKKLVLLPCAKDWCSLAVCNLVFEG